MAVFLAEDFIVSLAVEEFLGAGSLALVQADNVVLLTHFITIDGAEGGSKTTEAGETEHATILDTVVGFSGEGGAHGPVHDAGAAVGFISKF